MKKNSKDVVTYTEDEIRSDPYGFTLKEITEVLGEQEPGIHCSSGTIDSSRPMRTRPDNRISSRVAALMILLRNSARLWLSTRELDMGRDLSFKFDRKSFTTV